MKRDVARIERNVEIFGFPNYLVADDLRGFPCGDRELHFLPDEVIELICSKISRNILHRGVHRNNEHQQNEKLSAAQAKHDVKL